MYVAPDGFFFYINERLVAIYLIFVAFLERNNQNNNNYLQINKKILLVRIYFYIFLLFTYVCRNQRETKK